MGCRHVVIAIGIHANTVRRFQLYAELVLRPQSKPKMGDSLRPERFKLSVTTVSEEFSLGALMTYPPGPYLDSDS